MFHTGSAGCQQHGVCKRCDTMWVIQQTIFRAMERRITRGLALAVHARPRLVVPAGAGLALRDVLGCAFTVPVADGLLAWTGGVLALAFVNAARWVRLALVAPAFQAVVALVALAPAVAALLVAASAFVILAFALASAKQAAHHEPPRVVFEVIIDRGHQSIIVSKHALLSAHGLQDQQQRESQDSKAVERGHDG